LIVPEGVMIQCCVDGDVTQLRRWARCGVRVRSVEPLLQAAMGGKVAVVMFLVRDLGADVNGADARGCTAVYVAALKGHEAIVRCLARDLGANVNQASEKGCTPLLVAAQNGV
jgi:ankyrin repeat protein